MGVIKGQNLRLKVGNKFVAFATSCVAHASINLEESSTKDSTNNFTEQEITGISWDLSTDALYSVTTDTGAMNGEEALNLVLAQQKVQVQFLGTEPASTKNRTPTAGTVYTGYAWVNDISINATNRQNTSYSLQLTGDGPLTAATSSSSGI